MKAIRKLQELAARVDGHLSCFEVDLGNKVEPWVPPPVPVEDRKPKVVYPSLYIYDRKDKGIAELPKSGKAIVSYRVRSSGVRTNDDGEDRYNADIEIRSIDPVKKKTGGAKNELEAIVGRYTEFDLRARNGAGQYAQGNEPPSPEDIAAAYGSRKRRKQVAAAAVLGGSAVVAGGKLAAGLLRAR